MELANKPYTRDSYKWNQDGTSGNIVREWIYEMAAHVRSVDDNDMARTCNVSYIWYVLHLDIEHMHIAVGTCILRG